MDPKDNRYYVGYDYEKGSAVVRFHLPKETQEILEYLRTSSDLFVSLGQHVSGEYIKNSLHETALDRLLRKMGIGKESANGSRAAKKPGSLKNRKTPKKA